MSLLRQAAINLANAGIPVFPCVEDGKAPATANGFHDATTDLATIEAWWAINPNYNIGVCPDDAGWAVVDLDPPGGISNWAVLWQERMGSQDARTYAVHTPRKGIHLYFSGRVGASAGKLGEGIDTRGIGSYILVPPSVVGGKPYTVLADNDLADLPEWIPELVNAKRAEVAAAVDALDLPGNIERARTYLLGLVKRLDVAVEGRGGDNRTYQLCCEVINLGLSAEKAHELICELWNPHCVPPWGEGELWTKVYNASRYAQNEAGAWAVAPAAEVFGDALDRIAPPSAPERRSRFHAEPEDEQEQTPDPKWLVREVLSEASTALMIGKTQSYKSFLALDLALGVSAGVQTFGQDTEAGLVFYAALEGKANLKRARRRAWKLGRQIEGKLDNFYVLTAPIIAIDTEVQEFGDEIARVCAGRRPKIIVLDTVAKCMVGLNENDARDAGRFVRFCDSLVETFGCTVIAVHHMGKDDTRGGRGSSALHAGFDTVLEVKAHRANKAVEVWVRKHKDADEAELPFTFQGRVLGPSLVFFPTSAQEHAELTKQEDAFAPTKIGATLLHLGARGEENAVTTQVLAMELTPQIEGESLEQRDTAISKTARKLGGLSKNQLRAYCLSSPAGLRWYIPAG